MTQEQAEDAAAFRNELAYLYGERDALSQTIREREESLAALETKPRS